MIKKKVVKKITILINSTKVTQISNKAKKHTHKIAKS